MKIRHFSRCSIVFAILFSIFFELIVSKSIVQNGFQKLEDMQTHSLVNAARRALHLKLINLDKLLIDWASWDDSYQFAQNYNPEYVDSNLPIETFVDQSLTCIAIQDRKGKVIYLQAINDKEEFEKDFAEKIFKKISGKLPPLPDTLNGQGGMITLETGELVMIAKRPILTSESLGPSMGTLTFASIISTSTLTEISSLLGADISLLDLTSEQELDINTVMQAKDRALILYGDEYTSTGFGAILGIKGAPIALIKVSTNRFFSQHGKKITNSQENKVIYLKMQNMMQRKMNNVILKLVSMN